MKLHVKHAAASDERAAPRWQAVPGVSSLGGMTKLVAVVGGAALVFGGWLAGGAGCGSAGADGSGGSAAGAHLAPLVATEDCIAYDGGAASGTGLATHAYTGKTVSELAGVSVVVTGVFANTWRQSPAQIEPGLVTSGSCELGSKVIFSLPQ